MHNGTSEFNLPVLAHADSLMLRSAFLLILLLVFCLHTNINAVTGDDNTTVRVFIFAGQSNMVGSDSKIEDIGRFPPFAGLDEPQKDVRFS
jgi:hypothetical protein